MVKVMFPLKLLGAMIGYLRDTVKPRELKTDSESLKVGPTHQYFVKVPQDILRYA